MNMLHISENSMVALQEVKNDLSGKFYWKFSSPNLERSTFHLLNINGKLLRPTLVFVGAESVGLNSMKFVNLAIAIEYLHISSLIHDDIIDKDDMRRGIETVHKKYGIENAILAGDALIARAVSLSSVYGEYVVKRIAEAAFLMCDGESMDFCTQRKKVDMTLKNYMDVAEKKTASLISTSISIAAVSEKMGDNVIGGLSKAGEKLGIAFQVRDDVVNSIGSFELGKRPGKDDKKFNRPNIVSVFEYQGESRKDAIERSIQLMAQQVTGAIQELSAFEKINYIKKILAAYFSEEDLRKYL
ncbi:MAG: polyprenyl synthetase family protein [Thermoplasmatales archaeon]|nr:polyprenyl synthetase family protein [Candidatus Thermoplasmatota archaeon]MDA8055834.1 polyprenyl synthetase family protein [Thermoplasmatales archaeon]